MFTCDFSTNIGKVRALISDTDADNAFLQDEPIQVFLDLEGGNLRLAAAHALDSIASNQALIDKKIKLLDLQTDGPAVAKSLRDHAGLLRAQDEDDGSFEIAEQMVTVFNEREYLLNQFLKGL